MTASLLRCFADGNQRLKDRVASLKCLPRLCPSTRLTSLLLSRRSLIFALRSSCPGPSPLSVSLSPWAHGSFESLSRRFTILRNSAGEPLSPSQVRQRLAEQRSRGEAIHISEEEEDMMIEALEHMRGAIVPQESSSTAAAGSAQSYLAHSSEPKTPPPRPRNFASSSPSVSPGSLNDSPAGSLFSSSSARLRDERQFRLASKASDRSLQSTATSFSSPTTSRIRESADRATAARSSSAAHDLHVQRANRSTTAASSSDGAVTRGIHDSTGNDIENLTPSSAPLPAFTPSGKEVTPALVRRASLALAQALRDLEREMGLLQGDGRGELLDNDDDDTVLAPYIAQSHRSSPPSSGSTSLRRVRATA
jgi:hypothetical protein